jgi:hypothetical protein
VIRAKRAALLLPFLETIATEFGRRSGCRQREAPRGMLAAAVEDGDGINMKRWRGWG